MELLRQRIHEIRRRSLWQVLGILVASAISPVLHALPSNVGGRTLSGDSP